MYCKSYSKMYGTEPQYNDVWYDNIPDVTMRIQRTEGKIFPDITILSVHSHSKTLNLIQKSSISNVSVDNFLRWYTKMILFLSLFIHFMLLVIQWFS